MPGANTDAVSHYGFEGAETLIWPEGAETLTSSTVRNFPSAFEILLLLIEYPLVLIIPK
jgi:hypothetical protein